MRTRIPQTKCFARLKSRAWIETAHAIAIVQPVSVLRPAEKPGVD